MFPSSPAAPVAPPQPVPAPPLQPVGKKPSAAGPETFLGAIAPTQGQIQSGTKTLMGQ